MEHSTAEGLLEELDCRWAQSAAAGFQRVSIQLCGRRIALQFPSQERPTLIEDALRGWRTQTDECPEAVFRFWSDRQDLPAGPPPGAGIYAYRQPGSRNVYRAGRWMLGTDPLRGIYSCCYQSDGLTPLPYWLASLLSSLWAERSGLLPVHSASVGLGGSGVLIAAESGGGKSTLAVSCLLAGMELVSDDFLFLTAQGPLRAMPLFSAVKLNPDMAERLQPNLPVLWTDQGRGGKQLLDVSRCSFSSGMDIKGMVFLRRWPEKEPELVPARGPLLLRLVRAAAGQAGGLGGSDRLRALAERLSGLPAYELYLSADTEKNAAELKSLIEKRF